MINFVASEGALLVEQSVYRPDPQIIPNDRPILNDEKI